MFFWISGRSLVDKLHEQYSLSHEAALCISKLMETAKIKAENKEINEFVARTGLKVIWANEAFLVDDTGNFHNREGWERYHLSRLRAMAQERDAFVAEYEAAKARIQEARKKPGRPKKIES